MEHFFILHIAKTDILELDIALNVGFVKIAIIGNMTIGVQNLKHPIGSHHAHL